MLLRFQWHIGKFALGVRLEPGFILMAPLNNTKRIWNQKVVFSEKPIRKRNRTKKPHRDFVTIIFQSQKQKKTKKIKVLRE